MSKKKKPEVHPGFDVIVATDVPPVGALCKQWCKNPATMTMRIVNTRFLEETEYVLCDEHAMSIAYKEYGPYLHLVPERSRASNRSL